MEADETVGRAAEIVAAYVANNNLPLAELPGLIATVHAALAGLVRAAPSEEPAATKLTTVQIRRSITPEALISFEDGKPYKTLRRHLSLRDLTPEAYRTKWGLPADYPMTARAYSEHRSELARSLGLGRARTTAASQSPSTTASNESTAPKRRGRRKAAQ